MKARHHYQGAGGMKHIIIMFIFVVTITSLGLMPSPTSAAQSEDAPFFFSTMTHMEGGHFDDRDQQMFLRHVNLLRHGIELADEYAAKLTIESEQPFARANTIWGINMMQEIVDRGHGVGTHCDFGFRDSLMSVEEYAAYFTENKQLVDDLVGAENNRGCSGSGSVNDYVLAAAMSGFDYIDGIVSMHYLSMPMENRPSPQWTDQYIRSGNHHENSPLELYERLYPFMVADATDFVADEDGIIMISSGGLGAIQNLEEEANGTDCPNKCRFTRADVDVLVEQLRQIDHNRDVSRVAKTDVYIAAEYFDQSNDDALHYFFSEVQKLQDEGIITWATQGGVYDAYSEWNETPIEQTQAYMTFAINIHDWVNVGNSAQVIMDLVNLFETNGVRGDFYLTAPMTRFYAEQYPEALERLCNSNMTISYHVRPPHPIYNGFDSTLQGLDGQELYDAIYAAETQRLDLATGELISDELGGYAYVTKQCGRNPVALGLPTGNPVIRNAAWQVYTDLGAQMVIMEHETGATLRYANGLWTRPSDFSITRWEIDDGRRDNFWWNMLGRPLADQYNPLIYLQNQLTDWTASADRPAYITMLIHENNFTRRSATPWANVYFTDGQKTTPLSPPYDLTAPDASQPRSPENIQAIWEHYSAVVAYAAANSDIEVVTSEDIVRMANETG
jgi:hypothetical protein